MGGLYYQGRFISYTDLAGHEISCQNAYFREALEFCKAYLKGFQGFHIQTSGSTGSPKTITLARRQFQLSAHATINALGLQPEFRSLVCISTNHIGGKMMLVRGMELNMELFLMEPTADLHMLKLPAIDFVALVPLQLQSLVATTSGRDFLSQCKVTIIGGASIDHELEQQLEQFPHPIYQTFGMTETASHFALRQLNGKGKQSHYHAFENLELSVDQRGCLIVSGEITNNKPVVTNDLIELIDTKEFKWLGRWDRVINSGGYKVHPEKLQPVMQKLLASMGIVSEFAIIGAPDPKWGEKVVLVLEKGPAGNELEVQIMDLLKNKLPAYEVPKSIKYLNIFPRTTTGKVDIAGVMQRLRSS